MRLRFKRTKHKTTSSPKPKKTLGIKTRIRSIFRWHRLFTPGRIKEFFVTEYRKREIIKWLLVLIIIPSVWLIIEILTPLRYIVKKIEVKQVEYLSFGNHPLKIFNDYDRVFAQRELFKPSLQATATGGIARIGIRQMAEQLSLIGIMSVSNKFHAFITNKKESSTGLYKKGDEIAEFQITKITKDKVTIQYAGQSIDLKK